MTETAPPPPAKPGAKKKIKKRTVQLPGEGRQGVSRGRMPIVPPQNVAGNALVLVIAIMTFLSCLTLGAVTLVRDTAATWQSEIANTKIYQN